MEEVQSDAAEDVSGVEHQSAADTSAADVAEVDNVQDAAVGQETSSTADVSDSPAGPGTVSAVEGNTDAADTSNAASGAASDTSASTDVAATEGEGVFARMSEEVEKGISDAEARFHQMINEIKDELRTLNFTEGSRVFGMLHELRVHVTGK